ncbi:MAG: IclR family transcriptional regulator [Anaerolineae bacterium]|nr:IclR family transcriptional regulator [Anaerolineae bacterium]
MSGIQSLSRGLLILDCVASAGRSVSITEVAQMLQIDKSSASRLVKTLVQHDYLQPERGSRRFVLGKRMYQISWQLLNRMPVREKAKPYLYRLVQATGECSHTAVYSEGKALMIDDVEAEASLRVVGGVGRRIPLHCTAVGKSLLAFAHLPLPAVLETKTPRTITHTNELKAHLAEVRAAGYALDDEEHEPGVRCLAAPVYDAMGNVIASIGISGPTVRVTDDRIEGLALHVMRAAQALSAELGYVALPEAQVGD